MHNNKDFGWVEFHHGSDEIALCNLLRAPCYAKWPLYHVKWALLQDAGEPGAGLLFSFRPLWSASLSRIQQKREAERGGRNVPLNFSWMIFVRREGTSVFMKGPGRGRSESRMQPSGPVYPRTCAMPHTNGKIQPVLQFLRLQLKSTLPLPSVLLAWGYRLCTCEGAVIPEGVWGWGFGGCWCSAL